MAWSVASAAYLFALPFWLPIVFGLDGADLIVRAGLCVLVLAPAGFLMGFGFPTGMRLVSTINAGPSALVLGHQGRCRCFSIDTTLRIGATCYLLVAAPALLLMSDQRAIRPSSIRIAAPIRLSALIQISMMRSTSSSLRRDCDHSCPTSSCDGSACC